MNSVEWKRCGCGALVKLPNLKARAVMCDACHRARAHAVEAEHAATKRVEPCTVAYDPGYPDSITLGGRTILACERVPVGGGLAFPADWEYRCDCAPCSRRNGTPDATRAEKPLPGLAAWLPTDDIWDYQPEGKLTSALAGWRAAKTWIDSGYIAPEHHAKLLTSSLGYYALVGDVVRFASDQNTRITGTVTGVFGTDECVVTTDGGEEWHVFESECTLITPRHEKPTEPDGSFDSSCLPDLLGRVW